MAISRASVTDIPTSSQHRKRPVVAICHANMKTFTSVLASSLLLALPAAAENALVYLSGSPSIDDPPASLSPSDTRLVIAQRLGLSRYHDLNDAGEDTLRAINAYGSSSQSILSTGQQEHSRQAFVVIEGVVEPEGTTSPLIRLHNAASDSDFDLKGSSRI